ncbi:MAG: ATP-binding protein [Deferrisomatales bacterium]
MAGREWERGLLGLEGLRGAELLEALRRLADADQALFWSAAPGRALCLHFRAGAEGVAVAPPGEGFPWNEGRGGVALLRGGARPLLPQEAGFPAARWALAAAGAGGAFAALLLGRGEPPLPLAEDALLADALVRRLSALAPASGDGTPATAEALLARLSHELKTPLVSVKGYAELLLDRAEPPLSPVCREWARRIAAGANRLAALFDRVLAHARTASPWTYLPGPVDLRDLARRSVAEAAKTATDRDLRWEERIPEGLGPVSLDRDAGRAVLSELLQNAARATPDGGVVRVLGRGEERGGAPGARLTVADTGVGIPAGEASERLFERFSGKSDPLGHYSGDFAFGAAGLGLGLATVRGVLRAHGGEAWAEGQGADPARLPGASVHLWLPLHRGVDEPPAPGAGSPGGRVLLVEPDEDACRVLEAALGDELVVVTARTAAQAVALWAEGEWVGCVVEPRLPDGGGVELLKVLRDGAPGPGAVILTYSTGAAAENDAWRAAGADGCVPKPARARALAQRLRILRARRVDARGPAPFTP